MNRKNSHTPGRDRTPEPTSRSSGRRSGWVLEAMRHLFDAATAARRS